jgi:hypothetical protein
MRFSLAVRARPGVSAYVEVFILIAIAVGGSGIVMAATSSYPQSLEGPSVSVADASIRQGAYLAIESLTVDNTGQVPTASITVSTVPVSPSASFCYSLANPSTMATISTTCPNLATGPGTLAVPCSLAPGNAVTVELTIMGKPFGVGSGEVVTVSSSAGASQSLSVQVVPA